MTTIAILADVHGNVPALEAVLSDLDRHSVDEVLHGGDLVGRGPQGREVVDMVRARGWRGVRGNHEDYLVAFRQGNVRKEWLHGPEWAAARWMAAQLGDDGEAYARGLPISLTAETAPELRLVHGTPRSNQESIGPWTADEEIDERLAGIDEPLVVCAHTHRPLVRRPGRRLVVNVGSVGLPFDGDHRACYALLRRNAEGWHAEHRRLEWDRDRLLRLYRRTGFLEAGGITAALLEMEVRTARSQLVPFLDWARASGRAADAAALDEFRTTAARGSPAADGAAAARQAMPANRS